MYEMSKSAESTMRQELNQLKHALDKSQAELKCHLDEASTKKKEGEMLLDRNVSKLSNFMNYL